VSPIDIRTQLVIGPVNGGQLMLRRLVAAGLKKYECEECGLGSVWNEKPIVHHLDHINGERRDNRLENLRVLCPNCHSQTPTYCGRNLRQAQRYCTCGIPIGQKSKTCRSCRSYEMPHPTKITWPATDTLHRMVAESSYLAVGKKLGVSDNAVRKRLRNH
jgi:hypothetical protein